MYRLDKLESAIPEMLEKDPSRDKKLQQSKAEQRDEHGAQRACDWPRPSGHSWGYGQGGGIQ